METDVEKKEKKEAGTLARTSSILGTVSLPLSWTIFGLLIAILAIILSLVGSAIDKNPNKLKKKCLKTVSVSVIIGTIPN